MFKKIKGVLLLYLINFQNLVYAQDSLTLCNIKKAFNLTTNNSCVMNENIGIGFNQSLMIFTIFIFSSFMIFVAISLVKILFNLIKNNEMKEKFNVFIVIMVVITLTLMIPFKANGQFTNGLMFLIKNNIVKSVENTEKILKDNEKQVFYNIRVNSLKYNNEFEDVIFDITNNFTKSLSERSNHKDLTVLIKDLGNEYRSSININNDKYSFAYKKDVDLVNNAKNVGFNTDTILKKEKDLALTIFNQTVKNGLGTAIFINKNYEVGNGTISFFKNNDGMKFEQYFQNNIKMCDSLYDKNVFNLNGISTSSLYLYEKFSSFCSNSQINNLITLDKDKTNYDLMGNEIVYSGKEIINKAKMICASNEPLLICKQALDYASKIKAKEKANFGLIDNIANSIIKDKMPSSINNSGYVSSFNFTTKRTDLDMIENTEIFGNTIKDYRFVINSIRNDVLNKELKFIKANKYELWLKENMTNLSTYAIEIQNYYVDVTTAPFKRFSSCATNPNTRNNGYICQTPTKEFSIMSRSLGNIAIYISYYTKANMSNKNKKEIAQVGNLLGTKVKKNINNMLNIYGLSGNSPDFTGAGESTIGTGLYFAKVVAVFYNSSEFGRYTIDTVQDNIYYLLYASYYFSVMSLYIFLFILYKCVEMIIQSALLVLKVKPMILNGENGMNYIMQELRGLFIKSVTIIPLATLCIYLFLFNKERIMMQVFEVYLPSLPDTFNITTLLVLLQQYFIFYVVLFFAISFGCGFLLNQVFNIFNITADTKDAEMREEDNFGQRKTFNKIKNKMLRK